MVLSGTCGLSSATGIRRGAAYAWRRLHLEALNSFTLGIIFFNLCKACLERTMAAIPPSAFSAGRIRETQRDMVSNPTKMQGGESFKFFNTKLTELSPLKYNSKLMNSIWGFYNRYSPHNVKKVNDALVFNVELEQSAANSTNKNESKITLTSANLDNVWAAMNFSQSY